MTLVVNNNHLKILKKNIKTDEKNGIQLLQIQYFDITVRLFKQNFNVRAESVITGGNTFLKLDTIMQQELSINKQFPGKLGCI